MRILLSALLLTLPMTAAHAQQRLLPGRQADSGVCSVPLLTTPGQPTESPIARLPESNPARMPEVTVPAPSCAPESRLEVSSGLRPRDLMNLRKGLPRLPTETMKPIPEFRFLPRLPRR